jgi:hypothetical protein
MAAGACTCRTQERSDCGPRWSITDPSSVVPADALRSRSMKGATPGEVSRATRLAAYFSECPCLQGLLSGSGNATSPVATLCVAPMVQNMTYGWWVVALALAALAIWLLP